MGRPRPAPLGTGSRVIMIMLYVRVAAEYQPSFPARRATLTIELPAQPRGLRVTAELPRGTVARVLGW